MCYIEIITTDFIRTLTIKTPCSISGRCVTRALIAVSPPYDSVPVGEIRNFTRPIWRRPPGRDAHKLRVEGGYFRLWNSVNIGGGLHSPFNMRCVSWDDTVMPYDLITFSHPVRGGACSRRRCRLVMTNLVMVVGLRMNKISYKIATKLNRVWKLQNANYRILTKYNTL